MANILPCALTLSCLSKPRDALPPFFSTFPPLLALTVPHVIPYTHPLKPCIYSQEVVRHLTRSCSISLLPHTSSPYQGGHERRIHRLGPSRSCCGDGKYDARRRPSSLRPLDSARPHSREHPFKTECVTTVDKTNTCLRLLCYTRPPAPYLPTYYRVTFDIEN